MNSKAQISVEFIIVLVLLFSLFLFSLWVFAERNTGYIYSRENHEAMLLANKLARTINNVYLAGNGMEAELLLEKRGDFNVSVSGNAVIVSWRDNYLDAALLTDEISAGGVEIGQKVNVKNVNGGVVVESA